MPKSLLSRFSGEKILIADDEKAIVNLTSVFLMDRGFEILTAVDGLDCLCLVEQERPALVLLDYMMPVMDGLTALKKIRSQYLDTHVIMLTGKGSEEVAVLLMKAGASDYLQKPFASNSLLKKIDHVLQLRQMELENRKLIDEQRCLQQEIEDWNLELEDRVLDKTQALELAQAEIIQVEKLAALGHVSAGLAHEIRNPLNSISLFAQLLKPALSESEEHQSYLNSIAQEVDRIDKILLQMLLASKGSGRLRSPLCLAESLQKVLQLCDVQIRSQGVIVKTEIDAQLQPLTADEAEIEQIFSNLIGNALSEMLEGGTLTICLSGDKDVLKLQVSDTGKGIPAENFARIFDPFFTTKEKGTGFGLSVVLRIVKGYGGRIQVVSPEGEGATFFVELPLTDSVPVK